MKNDELGKFSSSIMALIDALEKENKPIHDFENHIKGIISYITEKKNNEPGYVYDNFKEYNKLKKKVQQENLKSNYIDSSMDYLLSELTLKKQAPTRTKEEEAFYKHIVGINSYISERKKVQDNYVFDNVAQVEGLLTIMEQLSTKDESIIAIMTIITRDISITINNIIGELESEQYKQRIQELGIYVDPKSEDFHKGFVK